MSTFDEEEVADPVAEMGFDQYGHLLAAVRLGLDIKEDFAVEGPLAQYAKYVEGQAVVAMAALITLSSDSIAAKEEGHRAIAAYAHLMFWLKDTARQATQADEHIEIRREGATEESL